MNHLFMPLSRWRLPLREKPSREHGLLTRLRAVHSTRPPRKDGIVNAVRRADRIGRSAMLGGVLVAACGPSVPTSKLEAEERGFEERFGKCASEVYSLARKFSDAVEDKELCLELSEPDKSNADGYRLQLSQAIEPSTSELRVLDPPGLYKLVHSGLLSLETSLKAAITDRGLRTECVGYVKSYNALLRAVTNRPDVVVPRKLSVAVKAKLGPFAYDILTQAVEASLGNEFVGLTAKYKASDGPKLLRVICGDHQRFFYLGVPFEVYLPGELGVSVENDAQSLLTLRLMERGG